MRKRLVMVWTLVVVCVTLALPASSLASSRYRAVVLYDECQLHTGPTGFGWAELTLRAKEVRRSGVNYFVVKSEVQERQNGQWFGHFSWLDETSAWFPNNRASHSYTVDRYFDFDWRGSVYDHRIVIRVEYWSSALGLITSRTRYGTVC